jgi:ATP-binding cassette subfamily B protein
MARHSRHDDPTDEDLPPVRITSQGLREAAQLARYLWPYRFKFAAALTALLLSSLLGLAFPAVTGRLIDASLPGRTPGAPTMDVNGIALALLGVLALQATFSFFRSLWLNEVGERSLADLRRDTYGRLVRLPMAFHTRRRVGELSSRIAADLAQIDDALIEAVPQFLRQLTVLVGGVALIALTSGRLTLIMLSTFPALILVAVLFGRLIRRNSRLAQDRLADSNVIVEETLQGIASVKAFANEGHEETRYRQSLDEFLRAVLRGALFRGAFASFIIFALFGAVVLVLWYGTRMVQAGDLSPGALTSFMLYTLFVAGAMGSFAELYGQLQRTLGASQRVRELLHKQPEPVDPTPAAGPVQRLRGDVAFERVSFRYPSRKEVEVLRAVSLEARAGQRIALVGPSGAGKSTLVSLLPRFYEPDDGRVLIDGRDAREYPLHALRSQMAIVPQDVLLFGGSILDNIAYGRPGASEAEVIEAARAANAHDFISAFPEGYQTRVGERGIQLSGGQRQRVAIARAILRDPAILILDEATSSLDSESESLVLQALDRLMEGRTSLIIAHRLSTVRRADCIYVLKEGTTVEAGTHAELVQREHGVYRTLSELQLDLT